jgi:hypothetical protein
MKPRGFLALALLFETSGMPSPEEKLAFAERLKQALTRSSKKIDSAAELALQFNLRNPSEPVSAQAAHKWLTGRTMPTVDKMALYKFTAAFIRAFASIANELEEAGYTPAEIAILKDEASHFDKVPGPACGSARCGRP